MFGWAGKILTLDLTTKEISTIQTEPYQERFLGGLGIGQKIYWDEASPHEDAFHPSNPLIFMTGPLAATPAPAASRMVICGKSPCLYPETFASANLGGHIAAELKKAGYDGLVIKGQAATPVYLCINDDRVELRDATHLWGMTTSKTHEAIHKEVEKKSRILSIGPAGEARTRMGIIFSDLASTASVGFGSVMGSKNLKAVAVKGSGTIPVANRDKITRIRKRIKEMRGEGFFNLYGTPTLLPETKVLKKSHCHGCPEGCWRTLQKGTTGEEAIRKCQAVFFYSLWDRKLHNGQATDASFHGATIANDYGICAMDLVFILLWFEQCLEKGLLSEKEIGLDVSQMGSNSFLESFIKKICEKDGFGKTLAEGAMRASKQVGRESETITQNLLSQTGRGIAYGPKVFFQSALIYATEPRPSISELHGICEPFIKWALWHHSKTIKTYVSTQVLQGIGKVFWGSEQAVDCSNYDGMALASQLIQNRQLVKESLVLCDFTWPIYDDASTEDHIGDPSLFSQLFEAVTGRETSEEEMNRIGERIFTLNRAILLREGRNGRTDDYLPEFFFIERDEMVADVSRVHNPDLLMPGSGDHVVSRKGKAVDKKEFERILTEYYQLRNWDVKTGFLKKNALIGLELEEVIEPLKEKVV